MNKYKIKQSIRLAQQNIAQIHKIQQATEDKVTLNSMLQSNHSIIKYLSD